MRERIQGDIQNLLCVLDDCFDLQLACPDLPVTELERYLLIVLPDTFPQHLKEDFVTTGLELRLCHHTFPDSKKAAHRVGNIGKEDPSQERCPKGDDPPLERPFSDASSFHIPAAYDDIGACPDFFIHLWDDRGGMGKVGVDDNKDL